MSELTAYYEAFRTGYWADHSEAVCRCRGNGWALSEVDTWHMCPAHYCGQPHPEVMADAETEEEATAIELASRTEWAIRRGFASPISTMPAAPMVEAAEVSEDEIPF